MSPFVVHLENGIFQLYWDVIIAFERLHVRPTSYQMKRRGDSYFRNTVYLYPSNFVIHDILAIWNDIDAFAWRSNILKSEFFRIVILLVKRRVKMGTQ